MRTVMNEPVTVGVIVYNGASTLRRAVESVLAQTHQNILINISDDASTDETAQVGEDLARQHANVTYTRQKKNLGIFGNTRFALQQAQTQYFMWLAADDFILPTYIERTLAALEADPGLVACVSRVRFIRADGTETLARGTAPLMADVLTNLAVYLSAPVDNGRFYGLYRTAALKTAYPPTDFHALDWAVVAGTLLSGRHAEIPEVLMVRDWTPPLSYIKAVRADNPTTLGRLFPLLPMTRDLIFRQRMPLKSLTLRALLGINIITHYEYSRHYHSIYSSIFSPILSIFIRSHYQFRLKSVGKIDYSNNA
ncbi:MAG: glycosyltransferase [Rhodospirillales bacterium]|nr:glycosyltransferase [Rhodospirillales bacterium]